METKSRYEIIADLEQKKATLLNQQANLGLHETNLKIAVEKAQEELTQYTNEKGIRLQNIKDQIESIEKSLGRLNAQKK